MSSILLRKEHNGQKAGAVISVPFAVGKALIAKGVAEYFDADKPAEPVKSEAAHAPRGREAKATEIVPPQEPISSTPAMKPDFPPQPTSHSGSHEKRK